MKLITRNTDYALRALCFMAKDKKGRVFSVTDLSRKLKIPHPFLRRIFQVLDKKGILKSYKGRKGGFILKQNPENIFLWDLIKIFQGEPDLEECFFKNRLCPDIRRCLLRKKLLEMENYIVSQLKSLTVNSLLS
ncbi:MAG: Rrf2 family transcriptional regulator [Candidatus Omnitrophica bacterium]|nr:Rrf2 family transcriptional regulator [Candidatus Omnitrophota bacterium]